MYDTENPLNPFRGPYNESDLDGSAHRALAREAAARSMVLLKNAGGAVPLPPLSASSRVAVIGPFADCAVLAGGYGGHDSDKTYPPACSYGHSYSGFMSAVSTYLTATQEEAAAAGGANVTYVAGSGIGVSQPGGTQAAAAAAAAADIVLLCVGLGTIFEAEGNDRNTLLLPAPQDALATAVAGAMRPGSRLILVITSAGGVDVEIPRADAVLQVSWTGASAVPSDRARCSAIRVVLLLICPPRCGFRRSTPAKRLVTASGTSSPAA
jgi:beta-glucosidase